MSIGIVRKPPTLSVQCSIVASATTALSYRLTFPPAMRLGSAFTVLLRERPCFDDNEGLREWVIVGNRKMDDSRVAIGNEGIEPFGSPARKLHGRLAAGQVNNTHVAPEHAARKPRPERLGAGFLGGEALGIGRSPLRPPF